MYISIQLYIYIHTYTYLLCMIYVYDVYIYIYNASYIPVMFSASLSLAWIGVLQLDLNPIVEGKSTDLSMSPKLNEDRGRRNFSPRFHLPGQPIEGLDYF